MIRTIDFGIENGANVLIISGVHGDEVGAIKTSYDLYDKLQEIKASGRISRPIGYPKLGKVSFIHVANREGVRNGCRNMVYDGNLNNMFSTSSDPKCEIIKAIDDAQFVIDLHCSPYIASGFIFDVDYKSYLFRNFLDDKFFFELSSTELSYGIRHTEANTIKSYVNSLKGKFGFTWEQNGMNQHSLVKNVNILVKIISSFTKFSEYVENKFDLKLDDDVLSKKEIPFLCTTLINNNCISNRRNFNLSPIFRNCYAKGFHYCNDSKFKWKSTYSFNNRSL